VEAADIDYQFVVNKYPDIVITLKHKVKLLVLGDPKDGVNLGREGVVVGHAFVIVFALVSPAFVGLEWEKRVG